MPGRRLGIQTHMGMAVARPTVSASSGIPGPQGTLVVSFDASQQSIGSGTLGGSSDVGPVNPWESRADTVQFAPATNDGAGTYYGTWSIVSTPIGNALQGSLPVVSSTNRRCDLEKGNIVPFTSFTPPSSNNGSNYTMGADYYICSEFQLPTNWAAIFAGLTITPHSFVIEQSNQFPTGNQPGQFVMPQADYATLSLNAGFTADGLTFGNSTVQNLIPVGSLDVDPVWHQYVRHWKPATDNTGMYEGWWRRRGETSWTKTVEYNGHPTVYWFGTGTPDPTTSMRDTIDAYTKGGTVGGRVILHHKYARSIDGPGVLVDFLNS